MLQLLYQSFMTLCDLLTDLKKCSLRISNIASSFQRLLTWLAYCHSNCSECPALARMQARRRALHSSIALSTDSVQGHVKCLTYAASVPQRRELVTGTRAAGQGPKSGISNDGSVVGLPDSEPAPQRMKHFLQCAQISACHSTASAQTSQFRVVFWVDPLSHAFSSFYLTNALAALDRL